MALSRAYIQNAVGKPAWRMLLEKLIIWYEKKYYGNQTVIVFGGVKVEVVDGDVVYSSQYRLDHGLPLDCELSVIGTQELNLLRENAQQGPAAHANWIELAEWVNTRYKQEKEKSVWPWFNDETTPMSKVVLRIIKDLMDTNDTLIQRNKTFTDAGFVNPKEGN